MEVTHPGSNPFSQLVSDLRDILGPSSGIDSADVDPGQIQTLMQRYQSNLTDWKKYAWVDESRAYTRNLVDRGNGKSNLLILVWSPGKGSPIHDHADAHCVMKVLRGRLCESLYEWPRTEDGAVQPPQLKKTTILRENDVAYISDDIGLHRMSNPDPNDVAISLHLYTPPNAAFYGCHIFDERSGKSTHVKQCEFFSEKGQRCTEGAVRSSVL